MDKELSMIMSDLKTRIESFDGLKNNVKEIVEYLEPDADENYSIEFNTDSVKIRGFYDDVWRVNQIMEFDIPLILVVSDEWKNYYSLKNSIREQKIVIDKTKKDIESKTEALERQIMDLNETAIETRQSEIVVLNDRIMTANKVLKIDSDKLEILNKKLGL